MAYFFTADTHFNHHNIMRFCQHRTHSAETVDEMNEVMIKNWNRAVGPTDIVYHLGDVGFYSEQIAKQIIQRLNGRIHLMVGNHDRKEHLRAYAPYVESIERVGLSLKYHHTQLMLSHYAMDVPLTFFSIHGHSHEREYEELNKINVGVDSKICRHLPLGEPMREDALWKIIQERQKQINLIKEHTKKRRTR